MRLTPLMSHLHFGKTGSTGDLEGSFWSNCAAFAAPSIEETAPVEGVELRPLENGAGLGATFELHPSMVFPFGAVQFCSQSSLRHAGGVGENLTYALRPAGELSITIPVMVPPIGRLKNDKNPFCNLYLPRSLRHGRRI